MTDPRCTPRSQIPAAHHQSGLGARPTVGIRRGSPWAAERLGHSRYLSHSHTHTLTLCHLRHTPHHTQSRTRVTHSPTHSHTHTVSQHTHSHLRYTQHHTHSYTHSHSHCVTYDTYHITVTHMCHTVTYNIHLSQSHTHTVTYDTHCVTTYTSYMRCRSRRHTLSRTHVSHTLPPMTHTPCHSPTHHVSYTYTISHTVSHIVMHTHITHTRGVSLSHRGTERQPHAYGQGPGSPQWGAGQEPPGFVPQGWPEGASAWMWVRAGAWPRAPGWSLQSLGLGTGGGQRLSRSGTRAAP